MTLVALGGIALLSFAVLVEGGDWIPDRTCAALYSEVGFEGDEFKLKDFDQSVNLKKEYRHSLEGWQSTSSIRLEADCTAVVCSESYFLGSCIAVTENQPNLDPEHSSIGSVNCTCTRKCSCSDISVPSDEKDNGFFGRAYLNGGCHTCNSEYINMRKNKDFPDADESSVEAIMLAKECTMEIFPQPQYEGTSLFLEGAGYKNFSGTIGSHSYFCGDVEYKRPPPSTDPTYPPKIELPIGKEAFLKQVNSNQTLANHPGAKIAWDSVKNGRSSKHAYVMLIGARVPYWLGFPQCQGRSQEKIWECRMHAQMDHIGLSGELRLIIIPVGYNSNDLYRKLMATLDQFMATHEELKEVIPNAVIVYHWITDSQGNITEAGSSYQRKLGALHILRNRLLDESYPNVMFMLDDLDGLDKNGGSTRQPDEKVAMFEEEIIKKWAFPSPVNFIIRSDPQKYAHYRNGYMQMENREYWPRNLEVGLLNMCEKGEDPLGREIFKSVFNDVTAPHWHIPPIIHEITVNASTINKLPELKKLSPAQMQVGRAVSQAKWDLKKSEAQLQAQIQQVKSELAANMTAGGGQCGCQVDDDIENRIYKKLHKKLKSLFD